MYEEDSFQPQLQRWRYNLRRDYTRAERERLKHFFSDDFGRKVDDLVAELNDSQSGAWEKIEHSNKSKKDTHCATIIQFAVCLNIPNTVHNHMEPVPHIT